LGVSDAAAYSRLVGSGSVAPENNCRAATSQPAAPSEPKTKPIMASRLIAGGKVRRCGTVASPITRAAEVFRLSCSSVSRERFRKD